MTTVLFNQQVQLRQSKLLICNYVAYANLSFSTDGQSAKVEDDIDGRGARRCAAHVGLSNVHIVAMFENLRGRWFSLGFRHAEFNGARKNRFQPRFGVANLI